MKYYCNSTISWGEDGTGDHIAIPIPLPRVTSEWKQEVGEEMACNCRFWPSTVTT